MNIFSNPNFNLPLTVDLSLKDEKPFVFSKNGLSFVIKKNFVFDIEKRNDYYCCLLTLEILEGDIKDINIFVASPIIIHSVSKTRFYYSYNLSNILQSNENVILTLNFAFNYKENRIVTEIVSIIVPFFRAQPLKFGEYFCDTLYFPQIDHLKFESYWSKNLTNKGKVVYRYFIKNKKGVTINGFKSDFFVDFYEEYYLINCGIQQPCQVHFTIDLDELIPKSVISQMAANDSNPQCQDCIKSFVHHSVTNPHLYMHSLTTSLPYRRPCSTFHDIPSDTFMSISKQNVENNSPKKPIKRSFLSTLLQMPPQRKLPSLERKQKNVDNIEQISDEPNLLKKDKNQFAKAFEIKESVENDSKNLKNLQEVLLDIYLTDSEQPFEKLTLQKEIGTLKNLKSSETTINYSNNSSISLSKNEADIQELQRKITEIYFDVLIDSDAPKRISNIPAELSVNKYLEKMSCEEYSDTPVNDLLISKTDETKEFQTTDLKDKKNPAKRNVKLISQNYCNYTNTVDYGTMVSQATNFIPFTLKAIAELAFNKIKIDFCESERSLLKQIPLIVTNDKENDIKNRGSEFRVTFVTSDSSEIEEDSEMLSNVSPIFRAIIDASDKNDCKIDTNFNFETVSRALNYLHDSDEKYLQGYENEIYQFAEEYFIDFLKKKCSKSVSKCPM